MQNTTIEEEIQLPLNEAQDRSGEAFGLVCAAAASTALGAAAVFFPRLRKFGTAPVLAASLGFATGVMLFVSLVDIYGKSKQGFVDFGLSDDQAFIYATITFFGGIFLMKVCSIHSYTANFPCRLLDYHSIFSRFVVFFLGFDRF